MDVQMKRFYFPVVKGETIGNIASCIITTNALDRQNEIVEPDGASLANYMANPVVLYGHAYQGMESIPVGRAISLEIYHEGDTKGIKAQWEWQQDDVTPLISAVHKSWDRGFINTASIGFLASEYQDNHIVKWEMLEYSLVPVPANPTAMRLNGFTDPEIKALGVDVTPETLIADLEGMLSAKEGFGLSAKEGRVLSAKNYELITNAIDALTVLLDAADKSPSGDGQPKAETWLESLYKALLSK